MLYRNLATLATLATCFSLYASSVCAAELAPSVSLLEPVNGATVTSPFKVRFGVKGMTVVPAGDMSANTGHHHLLINEGALPAGTTVPADEKHIHFGKGQTETVVTLPPGTYKFTAQFANGAHQSYGPALSQTITVTVK